MPNTLLKGNSPKMRASCIIKNKPESENKKNSGQELFSHKKGAGKQINILNYQYQDSDLEQFV
ncbi:MAG: hypothetical protein WCG67_10280 [Ferruginibacter sp.]